MNWVKSAWKWGTSIYPKEILDINYEIPNKIRRLLIVIHGLDANLAHFTHIVNKFQYIVNADYVYAPYFKQENAGNLYKVTSDNFNEEIIKIQDKLTNDSEIIIIGLSNGGRIAMMLAKILAKMLAKMLVEKVNIIVFTIATPLKGSNIVKYLPKSLAIKKLGIDLYNELTSNSIDNNELIKTFKSLNNYNNIKVYHIVGENDQIVNPPTNAYFEENEYIMLSGLDHASLFDNQETLKFIRNHIKDNSTPLEKDINKGYIINNNFTWFLFYKVYISYNQETSINIPISQVDNINRQLSKYTLNIIDNAKFEIWIIDNKAIFVIEVNSIFNNPEYMRNILLNELILYKEGFTINLYNKNVYLLVDF